jgi:hypothetical protein
VSRQAQRHAQQAPGIADGAQHLTGRSLCWERATPWRIFASTTHERHGVARSQQ